MWARIPYRGVIEAVNILSQFTLFFNIYMHDQKTRLKITQLEKVRFIKVNKLKFIQVELP